ncbi:MAG: hypothetical protein GXP25_11065 [Planctomycetes bacterium]|nr:hypothetical protein [Planctomycetota bacterium]
MRSKAIAVLVILSLSVVCTAAEFKERPTSVPFTYVLDYGGDHLNNPDYIKQARKGPPYLMHLGTDTPCHSYFGAAFQWSRFRARLKGETVPKPDYAGEYRGRVAALTQLAKGLHEAGCKLVTPYVCMITFGGDHEKGTGFWETYENWDAYKEFGIGPKPPTDPFEWNQRLPDGKPKYFYRHDHPPYKPMFRYAACINHPSWKQYMFWVIRETARCGFDGVFVDNANLFRCYCDRCQKLFAEHLNKKYTPRQIKELFGGDTRLGKPGDGLRWTETQIFWDDCINTFLQEMRAEGAKVHGSFYMFPNALQHRPWAALISARDCDLVMAENSVGTCGTHPGSAKEEIIDGICVTHTNNNIFAHRHAAACSQRVRSALLTRPGYPKSLPELMMNRDVGALGLAEAAAFSGGGTFLHRPTKSAPFLAEVRDTYNRFFETHRDLYEGYYNYGQVAVACFAKQRYYSGNDQTRIAKPILEGLMKRHVLADPVTEVIFRPDILIKYRLLVLPEIEYLSDAEVNVVRAYVNAGGRVMVSGDVGKYDLFMREREELPFGQYSVSRLADEIVKSVLAYRPVRVIPEKPDLAPIRMACYTNFREKPERIVLHLVNYGVRLGRDAPPASEIKDIPVSIPLPRETRVESVRYSRPGQEDVKLPVTVEKNVATFTVPALRIYGVCSFRIERGAKK